jgi:ferredoxin
MVTRPMIQVEADKERCIGAGACAYTQPLVFDQDDDSGIVVILQPNPPYELLATVREAVDGCPARALSVIVEPADSTDDACGDAGPQSRPTPR